MYRTASTDDFTDDDGPAPRVPAGLAVAGVASIAAGAIHATAAGAHSEHRPTVVAFALLAAFQIGWGALALKPSRFRLWIALAGAAGSAVAIGGWVLAKTSGIGFVTGLEEAEDLQFADTLAAALAAVALLAVVGAMIAATGRFSARRRAHQGSSPVLAGAAAVAALALGLPGMISAGSHGHAGGHSDGDIAGHDHAASATPAKPYDATLPVDFSGAEGVTAKQQADAEELATVNIEKLPQWADTETAYARGYRSIGDSLTGFEHYINWQLIDDGKTLDPDYPESLVYLVEGEARTLAAAMYMLPNGTSLAATPDVGGELIQWHEHNDLCFAGEENAWRVADIAPPGEPCREGTFKFQENAPMIHVWIVPHECGAFSALEGIGGGQIPEGEERACDHAHGSTDPDAVGVAEPELEFGRGGPPQAPQGT